MPKRRDFHIIYEDDHFLVIDKKAGIPVIAERKKQELIPLLQQLKNLKQQDILPVHRIDKYTSGIILFAKHIEFQRILSKLFEEGKIHKEYLAIVEGKLNNKEWVSIDAPIFKKENTIKVAIHPKGKKAVTKFRTIEAFSNHTFIEVLLLTGRTHQIRVHMSHHGFPLLVDDIYGNREEFYLSHILKRKYQSGKSGTERPLMTRQTLHAHKISFLNPLNNETMEFEAEMPKDFKAVLNQLRKADNKKKI